MKRKSLSIASLILSVSLLLSVCVGCTSKKDKEADQNEEIATIFKGYEKQVKKLAVDKISKYASTSSIEFLDLDSDETEILTALLKKSKLEVTETKENKKKTSVTATVEVTYVDLESVLSNFDGQADKDSIIEAIGDEKANKETVDVVLKKEKDTWKITDDTEIYELLFNGADNLDYYLNPLEPTTTTTTEEPTTTTTEEPTTTTTEEPTTTTTEESSESSTSGSKPTGETFATQPRPAETEEHLKSPAEIDKLFKSHGFDVETDMDDGYKMTFYSCDADDIFLYVIEFDNQKAADELAQEMIDSFLYEGLEMQNGEISDKWEGNTHNIYSVHRKGDNHNYDIYIYQKGTILAIAGIDEYPNADVCVDYYKWLEEIGIWTFGIDF